MEAMEAIADVIEIAPSQEPEATPETTVEPGDKKPKAAALDSLDAVLRALNEQDEQLKAMKTQIQDMLSTNTALKRGIKQIVTDAQKSNELETELQSAKKKLSMLKSFING